MQPKLFALDLLNLARLIRKMGSKKKKWGESGGREKAPTFSKTEKMGKKKIKKWAQNGEIKKTRQFLKNGNAQS